MVGTLVWVKRQVPPPHTSHYILHTQLSAPSVPFFIYTLCIVYLSGNSAECPSFYSAQKLEPPRALQLYAAGASGQAAAGEQTPETPRQSFTVQSVQADVVIGYSEC